MGANRSRSLFYNDRRKRFAHDESEERLKRFTLGHTEIKTCEKLSKTRSLFKMSDFERKNKERMSKRANSQPEKQKCFLKLHMCSV